MKTTKSPIDVIRIGSKIVSRVKIYRMVDNLLKLRSQGLSQQEVAKRLELERSFISRIESLGEIRKGKRIALVGFPVANKEEIRVLCEKMGIEHIWLMSNEERWGLIRDRQALDFFNMLVNIVAQLKSFDLIILLSSERWHRIAEAFLDNEIVFWEIGKSPLEQDCLIDTGVLKKEIAQITN